MKQHKEIVCCTSECLGIGNRLKYLISCLRYYNDPNIIHLIWPDSGWVTCKFQDLFVFNIKTNIKEYNFLNESFTKEEELPTDWRLYVSQDEVSSINIENEDPFDKELPRIDFLYNKTPQNIIDIYQKYFSKLEPSESVKKIINTVDITPNMVAVQIRDNIDWSNDGRSFYTKLFIKEMKKYPKTTKFFVSTMNKKTMDIIMKKFPNQIVSIPNKDYSSMKYAVADLFLLSQPNKALCSCGSTFYEVAWWLGGSTAKVKVIGNYKNWESTVKLTFLEKIFSVKDTKDGNNKQITILGLKFIVKRKN